MHGVCVCVCDGKAQQEKRQFNLTLRLRDIVGFTTMSKEVQPVEVMSYLNALFTLFDEVVDQYGVYKVRQLLALRSLWC